MRPIPHTPTPPSSATPTPTPTPWTPRQRVSVALMVVTSALAACDGSPLAPAIDAERPAATSAIESAALVTVVDDATSRLLAGLAPDTPVMKAFGALRTAVASADRDRAIAAIEDATLALDFSRAGQTLDASDRSALLVQLEAIRAGVLVEGR